MTRATRLLLAAALALPFGPGAEAEPQAPEPSAFTATPDQIRSWLKSIEGTRRLPVTGVSLAKVGDKMILMSENGRFVVAGNFRLLDVWNGKEVKTLADGDDLNRLDLKRIGIKDADLAQLVYGTGPKHVHVFLDPWCGHCHDLLAQMEPLKKEYTFHLVLTPVLGDKSVATVKKLACLADKGKALDALLAQRYDGIPEPGPCDLAALQKTLIATRLMGIDGVPYLVLPSTKTRRGGTRELKALLEADAGASP
jgi:thiol:disulfide interchange protein DsbC